MRKIKGTVNLHLSRYAQKATLTVLLKSKLTVTSLLILKTQDLFLDSQNFGESSW